MPYPVNLRIPKKSEVYKDEKAWPMKVLSQPYLHHESERGESSSKVNSNYKNLIQSTPGLREKFEPNIDCENSRFFKILYEMLQESEKSEYSNIISWTKDGNGFKIHEKDALDFVLARFYDRVDYFSFLRQLNVIGFRNILDGPDKGSFRHELFCRDNPQCLNELVQASNKRKSASKHLDGTEVGKWRKVQDDNQMEKLQINSVDVQRNVQDLIKDADSSMNIMENIRRGKNSQEINAKALNVMKPMQRKVLIPLTEDQKERLPTTLLIDNNLMSWIPNLEIDSGTKHQVIEKGHFFSPSIASNNADLKSIQSNALPESQSPQSVQSESKRNSFSKHADDDSATISDDELTRDTMTSEVQKVFPLLPLDMKIEADKDIPKNCSSKSVANDLNGTFQQQVLFETPKTTCCVNDDFLRKGANILGAKVPSGKSLDLHSETVASIPVIPTSLKNLRTPEIIKSLSPTARKKGKIIPSVPLQENSSALMLQSQEEQTILNESSAKCSVGNRFIFLQALYDMLENSKEREYSHIISWNKDGKSFKLKEKDDFDVVLCRYFRHSNIQSFYRQLNIYGFKKVNCGENKGSFQHKNFLRGYPEKFKLIERVPVKMKNHQILENESDNEVLDTKSHSIYQSLVELKMKQEQGEHKVTRFVFLKALYEMLQKSAEEDYSSIISWLPCGTGFKIHQKDKVSSILSQFFRHNNILSFYRQLNIYGFQKITYGQDKGAFHHKFFLRDHPHCLDLIKREPIKTKTRQIFDSNDDKISDPEILLRKQGKADGKSRFLFLQALYDLLQNSDKGGYSEIISWIENGTGFKLHQKEKIHTVLSLYFRHNNVRSFSRQLNIYGFKKVRKGWSDEGAFKHKYFIRDKPEFISLIEREPLKAKVDEDKIDSDFEGHEECQPSFSNLLSHPVYETVAKRDYEALNFLRKIYELLETSDARGYSSILSWTDSGTSFTINKTSFQFILSRYFLINDIILFLEHLECYRFQILPIDVFKMVKFSHKHFIRGQPEKLQLIIEVRYMDFNAMKAGYKKDFKFQKNNRGSLKNPSSPFLSKLHELVERSQELGLSTIISWYGAGFHISSEEKLEALISELFGYNKIESFLEEILSYGFKKVKNTKGIDIYQHKFFLQGRPQFLGLIEKMQYSKELDNKDSILSFDQKQQLGKRGLKLPQIPKIAGDLTRKSLSMNEHRKNPTFIQALYDLLQESTDNNYSSVISWLKSGLGFRLRRTANLNYILSTFLQLHNVHSFYEMLLKYGFQKVRINEEEDSFQHKCFVRGQLNLLDSIKLIPKYDIALTLSLRDLKNSPAEGEKTNIEKHSILSLPKLSTLMETKNCKSESIRFLKSLHEMLKNSDKDSFSSIVSWISDKVFKIHKEENFEPVLFFYFRHNDIGSFYSELKRLGFAKIHDADSGSYHHELFNRYNSNAEKIVKGANFCTNYRNNEEFSEVKVTLGRVSSRISPLPNLSSKNNENSELNSKDERFRFLKALKEILDKAEKDGYSSVVSWFGPGFKIFDEKRFLPLLRLYFKHEDIQLFYEKLLTIGFVKINEGFDEGVFKHDSFGRSWLQQIHELTNVEENDEKEELTEISSVCNSESDLSEDLNAFQSKMKLIGSGNGTKFFFVRALYTMLQNSIKGRYTSVLSWAPDGSGFILHDREKVPEILSQYFRHDNIQSFFRQLNIYGFKKTPQEGIYKHHYFHRGREDLLYLVKRIPVKKKAN